MADAKGGSRADNDVSHVSVRVTESEPSLKTSAANSGNNSASNSGFSSSPQRKGSVKDNDNGADSKESGDDISHSSDGSSSRTSLFARFFGGRNKPKSKQSAGSVSSLDIFQRQRTNTMMADVGEIDNDTGAVVLPDMIGPTGLILFRKGVAEAADIAVDQRTLQVMIVKCGDMRKSIPEIITFDVTQTQDVRTGAIAWLSGDFTNPNGEFLPEIVDKSRLFTVLYGDKFILNRLSFQAPDKAEFAQWTSMFSSYVRSKHSIHSDYRRMLRSQLLRTWGTVPRKIVEGRPSYDPYSVLSGDNVTGLGHELGVELSQEKLSQVVTKTLTSLSRLSSEKEQIKSPAKARQSETLEQDEGRPVSIEDEINVPWTIADALTELYAQMQDVFDLRPTTLDKQFQSLFTHHEGILYMQEDNLKKFLREEQIETPAHYSRILKKFAKNPSLGLTEAEFMDFLLSQGNTALLETEKIPQDMTKPLTQYYVASSHNTYLQGKQIMDASSVDAYSRALLMGCRCVELDCWDGDKGPIITHGGTFCTKISFRDVVEVINQYAFVTSPYPVILSIENHCSVPQQDQMADIFLSVFGKKLLTEPVKGSASLDTAKTFPSPEDLKNKIIIKFKKSEFLEDEEPEKLGDEIKCGFVLLAPSSDGSSGADGVWPKVVFILTENKLVYATPRGANSELGEEVAYLRSEYEDLTQADDESSLQSQSCITIFDVAEVTADFPIHTIPHHPHVLRITVSRAGEEPDYLYIDAESPKERLAWMEVLPHPSLAGPTPSTAIASATASMTSAAAAGSELTAGARKSTGRQKISTKLSNLILYAQAVKFIDFTHSATYHKFFHVSSINESKAYRLMKMHPVAFNQHTLRNLLRIYPKGQRVNSSNYDPQIFWNVGAQLVALNYQTPDEPMWLNAAMFAQAHGCGYVLKPEMLQNPGFNVMDFDTYDAREEVVLNIKLLCARNVLLHTRGKISSYFVLVTISGLPFDSTKDELRSPVVSKSNPFPTWSSAEKRFVLCSPDIAIIKFYICSGKKSNVVAQCCLPVRALRPGYRSIPLCNEFNERLDLASLLVHINCTKTDATGEEVPWYPHGLPPVSSAQASGLTTRMSNIRLHNNTQTATTANGAADHLVVPETSRPAKEEAGKEVASSGLSESAAADATSPSSPLPVKVSTVAAAKAAAARKLREERKREYQSNLAEYMARCETENASTSVGARQAHPRFVGLDQKTILKYDAKSKIAEYIAKAPSGQRNVVRRLPAQPHERFIGLTETKKAPTNVQARTDSGVGSTAKRDSDAQSMRDRSKSSASLTISEPMPYAPGPSNIKRSASAKRALPSTPGAAGKSGGTSAPGSAASTKPRSATAGTDARASGSSPAPAPAAVAAATALRKLPAAKPTAAAAAPAPATKPRSASSAAGTKAAAAKADAPSPSPSTDVNRARSASSVTSPATSTTPGAAGPLVGTKARSASSASSTKPPARTASVKRPVSLPTANTLSPPSGQRAPSPSPSTASARSATSSRSVASSAASKARAGSVKRSASSSAGGTLSPASAAPARASSPTPSTASARSTASKAGPPTTKKTSASSSSTATATKAASAAAPATSQTLQVPGSSTQRAPSPSPSITSTHSAAPASATAGSGGVKRGASLKRSASAAVTKPVQLAAAGHGKTASAGAHSASASASPVATKPSSPAPSAHSSSGPSNSHTSSKSGSSAGLQRTHSNRSASAPASKVNLLAVPASASAAGVPAAGKDDNPAPSSSSSGGLASFFSLSWKRSASPNPGQDKAKAAETPQGQTQAAAQTDKKATASASATASSSTTATTTATTANAKSPAAKPSKGATS